MEGGLQNRLQVNPWEISEAGAVEVLHPLGRSLLLCKGESRAKERASRITALLESRSARFAIC